MKFFNWINAGRRKQYNFWKLMVDLFLFSLTAGTWIFVIVLREVWQHRG